MSAAKPKPRRRAQAPEGSIPSHVFDGAYFDRYYGDPKTRVQGPPEVTHLARAISSLAAFWGMSLDSALDLGAGPGFWRDALKQERPALAYRSVDVSPTACERYGHELRDISAWRADERFDLIICQGVLQYLDDNDAAQAIDNIGAMAQGLLYLEALTEHDAEEVADASRSDLAVHCRKGSWYRKRLAKHFVTLGCGLFYAHRGDALFFELETAGE